MREVAQANTVKNGSLVLSGFQSDLDLIACCVLGVLGKPMPGISSNDALAKVTSVVKDSGKEGYKFIFRKALEQSVYWKGEVAKHMESAVAAATLLPEVDTLQEQLAENLRVLQKKEALEQLRQSIKRLPLFRTSLQSKFLAGLETKIGEVFWLLLSEEPGPGAEDVESTLATVSQLIDDYLAVPLVEGSEHSTEQAKVAQSHCREMLQAFKIAKAEQEVKAALEPFNGPAVGLAEWEAVAKMVLAAEVLNEGAKAALTDKLGFLVSALSAELLGDMRKEVLESAFHTLKRLPAALSDENGMVVTEILEISHLFQDLRQARQPLEDVEKVFEKRDQREMRLKAGQLVQKLSACQALSPQLRNVQMFCQSLHTVQVETEKLLMRLKDEFQAKYEAVFAQSVEVVSPLVAKHGAWKTDLMGPRDSVSWKLLLKSAAHLLDTKVDHGTVDIMHLHSDFSKDCCSFHIVFSKSPKVCYLVLTTAFLQDMFVCRSLTHAVSVSCVARECGSHP